MFNKKDIPTSLKECYETDDVSRKLSQWADWLKIWGKRVLIILLIFGIFSTIEDAIAMADIDEDLVVLTIVSSLLSWGLYAFIEYCIYNAVALLVLALATIVQNTKISAYTALYNASKCESENVATTEMVETKSENAVKKEGKHLWRCNNCGKMRTESPCPNCGNE